VTQTQMIQTLLQAPIAFHRVFVTLTGSVASGLFLSQAWYWTLRNKDERDGWFYKSREEWFAETGLSRREQESARRELRGRQYLLEEHRGMPARLWFKLDLKVIVQDLSSLPVGRCPVGTKAPNKVARNEPTSRHDSAQHSYYTKTTTKTTSSSTRTPAKGAAAAAKNLDKETSTGRFPLDQIEAFIRATKPHKTEAQIGGLTRHLARTGEEDEQITEWLARQTQRSAHLEHSPECGLCQGTGWQVIAGKGARPCPNLLPQKTSP
jgi:hypothetical protein